MGVLGIAATGMEASILSNSVTANNIANSQTKGFKASRVDFSESNVAQAGQLANGTRSQIGQGVEAQAASPAAGNPQAASDVDLTTEMAALLQNGQSFKANAAAAKGADFMLETLLSMQR